MAKIIKRDIHKVFDAFRNRTFNEVYSELDSQMHMTLINNMLPKFARFVPNIRTKILDVGCGQGFACLKFKELGYENIIAITLSDEDVQATRNRGFECYKMDMSFLDFEDKTFGILWVRHSLEHSPFPYLTLLECNRVLADNGIAYVEMPMPDTPRRLENWPNHYSILGEKMWSSLFVRSGFEILVNTKIGFSIQIKDINNGKPFNQENFVFILQKERDEVLEV